MKIGGKADALQKLEQAGFQVPAFFVCDASWSNERIQAACRTELPGVEWFAVRSSAVGEDSTEQSFAGQFHSAIAVAAAAVPDAVAAVAASFAERAGSVIVQAFIPSDVSGVAFSDAGDGVVLINSTLGLCRTVVEGKACDEYVSGRDGSLQSVVIEEHKPTLLFTTGELETRDQGAPSLSDAQRRRVVSLALQAEKHFGKAQDIEWCFAGDTLYLLQSRPITRPVVLPELVYFDSANIAESYSGIVLPLTASFAERVYRVVYTDFLRQSGVPERALTEHAAVFANLLGFSHGRMYYHMNNWYRLAQFVPGYKRNKENFETMITSNLRQEIGTTIRPSVLFRLRYPFIVLGKVLVFGRTTRRFKRQVAAHITRLKRTDFANLSLAECRELFSFLENDLLRRWYITLENDFFVMTYLGLLQKLAPHAQLTDVLSFQSRATEQVARLAELAQLMQTAPAVWAAVQAGDGGAFQARLADEPALKHRYQEYLEEFGGRFANELKLETVGFDEDVTKFLDVLQAYAAAPPGAVAKSDGPVVELPFARRLVFRHGLRQFKKYAAQREEFRLFRSNLFSITRSLFRRMGVLLQAEGNLEAAADVFYLRVDEVLAAAHGEAAPDLVERVATRKREYATYADENPPSHFLARGGRRSGVGSEEASATSAARGVSAGVVTGTVRVMREFAMPERVDFDILVTRHTDPGWTALIALSKGLIIEHGGVLSHASIVARELGIPAVIGVTDATDRFVDGQRVELNGTTGEIKIL